MNTYCFHISKTGLLSISCLQAVMASDFAIAQFQFLEKLLVVHGHWCYKRIAQMVIHYGLNEIFTAVQKTVVIY